MDKFMEKVGLYDLWVITFPGAVFIILLKSIYGYMASVIVQPIKSEMIEKMLAFVQIDIYSPDDFYDFFILIAISYFSGIILQEISGVVKKEILYRNGKPETLFMDKDGGVLSQEQIDAYMPMFLELNNNTAFSTDDKKTFRLESGAVFRKINAILQQKDIAKKYVKLNVIYNMSLNLFVATTLLLLICLSFEVQFLIKEQYNAIMVTCGILFILLAASIAFWRRCKKYNIYWIRNMILAFEAQRNQKIETKN